MTNLLQVIQFTLLVTNTITEYEKEWIPVPCPDRMPGCLVYHAESRPKANPEHRNILTTITEIKRTIVPDLNLTNDVEKQISQLVQHEQREIIWKPVGKPSELRTSTNITWSMSGTNVILNLVPSTVTNVWMTNKIILK